jgi:DNA-directed RNA polymerase subunit D
MFQNLKFSENKISFKINGVDVGLMNAMRRAMIANVPTMAIEIVKVKENNGLLIDEMLAHRLSLIPLRRLSPFVTEAKFELIIEYDESKAVNGLHTIYSKDLKKDSMFGTDDVELVYDDIIITKLAKGHKIKLYATAVLGTGSVHAKWSPSCGTTYIENEKEGNYTFNIESTGVMPPEDIFKGSLEYLKDKLKGYLDE